MGITSDSRRGFFRLLSAIASIPGTVAIAGVSPVVPAAQVAVLPIIESELIFNAFRRCGLILPGEAVAQYDYAFAKSLVPSLTEVTDYRLAEKLLPYYK